jgi:LAS superfamily LD-carboxypeptidase LdcB
MTIAEYNQYPAKNEKGQWATFEKGKFTGYQEMVVIKSGGLDILVPPHMKPKLEQMIADAARVGVHLTIAKGFVTLSKQIEIRQLFMKKKFKEAGKLTDMDFLLTSSVYCYSPQVGVPGWSNHQNIKYSAIDWNVSITDSTGKRIGYLPSFFWLKDNAHKYGIIRTVESEGWHWEDRPGKDRYSKVAENHITWTKPL